MGEAFVTGREGGLRRNFKIVGGDSQPSNPVENTIWINTSEKITEYAFSAQKPTDPIEGMVWIQVSTSGSVSFNALKKHNLQVYPAKCQQYISEAWVDEEAVIYQNGEWIEWRTYLFDSGDERTSLTGGWGVSGYTSSEQTLHAGTVEGNVISISGTGSSRGRIGTQEAIDLTDIKLLKCNVSEIVTAPVSCRLRARTAKSYDSGKTLCELTINTAGEQSIDVSELEGDAYVSFLVYYGKLTIDAVWWE